MNYNYLSVLDILKPKETKSRGRVNWDVDGKKYWLELMRRKTGNPLQPLKKAV
jgi:hypothetical protein